MKDFTVSVKKLTDLSLMREACEATFIGKSNVDLKEMYKCEHSPVRTQLFWITMKQIPLFVSTHLLRHHVGSVPFQLSCRNDRRGGNPGLPEKVDQIANRLRSVTSDLYNGYNLGNALDAIHQTIDQMEWLKENTDRQTPVNLSILVNAQSLIDMAKLRLCNMAHEDTRKIFNAIKQEIAKIDPDLASLMVRKCVYRNGLCGELRCCGYNCTDAFYDELRDYASNFTQRQRGL